MVNMVFCFQGSWFFLFVTYTCICQIRHLCHLSLSMQVCGIFSHQISCKMNSTSLFNKPCVVRKCILHDCSTNGTGQVTYGCLTYSFGLIQISNPYVDKIMNKSTRKYKNAV